MNDEYNINPKTKNVNTVIFGVLSPQKIREQAVCKIDKYLSNIKETSADEGSVVDPRMGTTTKDKICPTCAQGYDLCPGHFGYIDLALPVYNLMYMPILIKILKCTCINCGELMIQLNGDDRKKELEKILQMNSKNRLNYLSSIVKITGECINCHYIQPKYLINKKEYISIDMYVKDPETKQYSNKPTRLNALDLWEFLSKISDQQCMYYGFDPQYSRPDWMIFKLLPVPPMHTRLILNISFNNKPCMDDLTVALNTNIVKLIMNYTN